MHDPREILKVCHKATEGPWKISIHPAGWIDIDHPKDPTQRLAIIVTKDDAEFIALARTALPEFAQRVIKLDKEVEVALGRINELAAVAEAAYALQKHLDLYDPRIYFTYTRDRDDLRKALADAGYGGEE